MLCTSKIHPFSLRNYLGTSLIIENLVIIRVTNVDWTWLGLEWPHVQYVALYKGDIVSPVSCALSCILAVSKSIFYSLQFSLAVVQTSFTPILLLDCVANISSPKHSLKLLQYFLVPVVYFVRISIFYRAQSTLITVFIVSQLLTSKFNWVCGAKPYF